MAEDLPTLDELLSKLVAVNGSDLHLKVGSPPAYRIDGKLHLSNLPKLKPDDIDRFATEILPDRMLAEFTATNEADFAYGKPSLGRYRVNCYKQRGSTTIVVRAVNPASKNFDELGLPPVIETLVAGQRGLVLVTGPTGSGKTTTLGSMIDHINTNQRLNIVTLEDPIEILHSDKQSIVSQREIGVDTASFEEGLRRVLRQDPDVILIGEMRDLHTMEAALQAAETGHLVLSTLHTIDSAETINRIIDSFPSDRQGQIRYVLAGSLKGIVSQRLVPRSDGKGRIPAVEVLVNTERVFDRIVDPTLTSTIPQVIDEGEFYGMQTFDQSILKFYEQGFVTYNDALAYCSNPADFKLKAQNRGLKTA
ncbi:MAG: PilT/PilU family type 4a pilus ATPase [Acidimicrobiia bacterium]|nr:PilT/PilU family type 4a pilus ATPase [Acidimicrobiia bacterium]NNF63489.1 PilT/PilU family type 4a pilus ATPase [Acidimicrobiia bacterium]